MNRICKKCKIEKKLSEFAKHKDCKEGREYRCKKCKNKHSIKNRDNYPWRNNRIAVLKLLKSKGCQNPDCNEDHPTCLDFHHLDPKTKSFSLADITGGAHSNAQYIKELEKCAIICANCHRKIHSGVLKLKLQPLERKDIIEIVNEIHGYEYVLH